VPTYLLSFKMSFPPHSPCFILLTTLLSSLQLSDAYPLHNKQETLITDPTEPKAVTCDPVSTYTTEGFLANTLPDYRREIHDHALFYMRGTSRTARDLAEQSDGEYITIWEVWPCWLYDDRRKESNRLRCIHGNDDKRTMFYENMSRAFARMARKSATIMHAFADYETVPQDGIWARVELPALQEATDVNQVRLPNVPC